MKMGQKKAFVTGANGFLGANLVRELVSTGWVVTAFHRASSDLWRLKGLDIHLAEGSFQNPASVEGSLPENIDAVFHLAARVSFWRGDDQLMERDNVEATRTIVNAAILRKVRRFIHTSTVSAYGFSDSRVDESFPKDGIKSGLGYMRTKALAESVVLDGMTRGLDAVILNPANVLGPLDSEHWGTSMQKVKEGKMPAAPPGSSSFAHVTEVAKAHISAVQSGKKGENYILAGTDASYLDVFVIMEEILGVRHKIKAAPKMALKSYGLVSQLISNFTRRAPYVTPELVRWLSSGMSYDSRKAIAELGYQPKTIQQMLKDCWASLN